MLVMRNLRGSSYSTSSYGTTPRRLPSPGKRSNYSLGQVGETRPTQGTTTGSTGAGALNQVKETASDLASRSTEAVSNFGTRFGDLMRDNPLAVGAMAVAAGAAVGLAVPGTRLETEYIGETGERLVEKVEDVARGALDQVKDAAKQMAPEGQRPTA